jgi:hypothetical protein
LFISKLYFSEKMILKYLLPMLLLLSGCSAEGKIITFLNNEWGKLS